MFNLPAISGDWSIEKMSNIKKNQALLWYSSGQSELSLLDSFALGFYSVAEFFLSDFIVDFPLSWIPVITLLIIHILCFILLIFAEDAAIMNAASSEIEANGQSFSTTSKICQAVPMNEKET